jgi:hypothetical protein
VTLVSGNGKTGPITVTRTTTGTCPDSCPLLGKGCYDQGGNGNIHRERHDAGIYKSVTPGEYLKKLAEFTRIFRHNEGGDLWGRGDKVDGGKVAKFIRRCDEEDKVPIVYTHKPVAGVHKRGKGKVRVANKTALSRALKGSLATINLSCDRLKEVDKAMERGFDAVVTIPSDANEKGRVTMTPEGRRVVHCPATWGNVSCGGGEGKKACGSGSPLCARKDRGYAVGFPAHGNRKKKVDLAILGQ